MNRIEIRSQNQLVVNGVPQTASFTSTLGLDASVAVINVRLSGSHILGEVVVTIDAGFGSVSRTYPFDIDTGLDNPTVIHLGDVDLFFGTVPVDGSFGWDIPARTLTLELLVSGVVAASSTVNW